MTKFYVIATPIGNLEDITFRALRILKEVDLILCEDKRVTKKLLDKYEIETPIMSYPADDPRYFEKIFKLIEEGKNIALVSDSGTPCISDPGSLLISKIKDLENIEIIPIPGPSALATALSASGVLSSDFLFLGFLPHKKGRETLFKEIANSKRTVVFYESPHRIIKALERLDEVMENTCKVTIARELTKIHEQIISGTPEELLQYFSQNLDKIKGEFVVIVS